MRPAHCLEQLRFQFRRVLFKVKRAAGIQSDLAIPVFQNNEFACIDFSDDPGELALGFEGSYYFLSSSLNLDRRTNNPCDDGRARLLTTTSGRELSKRCSTIHKKNTFA